MTIKELIDTYGLKEINTRTRISNDNLLNLLNEDYALMSKANALGFIKILEREFDADLSNLRQSVLEGAKDENYIPKDLVLTERRYGSKKKIANGALMFFVLLAGLIYVVYLINLENSPSTPEQTYANSTPETLPIIENTPLNEPLDDDKVVEEETVANEDALVDETSKDQNVVYEAIATIDDTQNESALLELAKEETVEVIDAASETQVVQSSEEDEVIIEQEAPKVIETITVEEVVIIPNRKVWLGYVNLDTNERVQKNNANEMMVDQDNTIIVTGHGWMQVSGKQYDSGDRLFFHFIDGELKRLNESAFRQLNGGQIW